MVWVAGNRKGKLIPQLKGPYCTQSQCNSLTDPHQLAILAVGGWLT